MSDTKHKILLLSSFGREGQPEDLAYLDIYLLSLKECVVPYFDVKVIMLFTGAGELTLTKQRLVDLELDKIVDARLITEMELPQESLSFWKELNWFSKVGMNMNLLFDYAQKHDFFGYDYIVHVDTDLEFLPNFKDTFNTLHNMTALNSHFLVTIAGDTFNYHFKYGKREYILEAPTRVNFYDESGSTLDRRSYPLRNVKIEDKDDELSISKGKLIFCIQQQKVRNDFVIMPRITAQQFGHTFNWISYHYPYDFTAHNPDDPNQVELERLYKQNRNDSNIEIHVNNDKGSVVQYFMQGSDHPITKIQLPAWGFMIHHYGSGWYMQVDFIKSSYKSLQKNYTQYNHLFEPDFANQSIPVESTIQVPVVENTQTTEVDELKNIILQLQSQLDSVKQILNSKM